eukprot:scaffold330422_cov79-Tisochrysis_lutea.AAC.1
MRARRRYPAGSSAARRCAEPHARLCHCSRRSSRRRRPTRARPMRKAEPMTAEWVRHTPLRLAHSQRAD